MPKHNDRDVHRSNRKDAPYNDNDNKGRNPHRQERQGNDERRHRRDDDTDPCSTFDDMKLKPDLLKGVYAYGFEKPSAIQQRAIRPIIRGRDVIAQSQSGTGKTAVFSISALQLLEESSRDVQVLVLSPTRELAEQSQRVLQSLGDFMNVRTWKE
jgi:superfamily II DNA/RNA helicase